MDERNAEEVVHDVQREAWSNAHARATLVRPLHGHDRDRVAALAREVNDLGVEDDAADLLAREQVVGGLAREALERRTAYPERAPSPTRRRELEDAAQQPAVERLTGTPVRAVGLDAAAQREVVVPQRVGQQGQLIWAVVAPGPRQR